MIKHFRPGGGLNQPPLHANRDKEIELPLLTLNISEKFFHARELQKVSKDGKF